MLLKNALKKVEKELKLKPKVNGKFYSFIYKNKVLEFLRNSDDTVHCISTRNVNDKSDAQSDYFAETFWDNLTQAINSLKNN